MSKSAFLGKSIWLRIAQTLWYPTASFALGIFIASIPGYFSGFSSGSLDELLLLSRSNWNLLLDLAYAAASISAALLSLGLALVLYRQKSVDRMSLFLSYFLLYYGTFFAGPIWVIANQWPQIPFSAISFISSLFFPLVITLVLLFPDGQFVPSWTRWLVLLTIPIIPLTFAFYPSMESFLAGPLVWIGILLALPVSLIALSAQIYRYRAVSDPVQRQQTKWVVYGLLLMFLCFMITTPPYVKMLQLPPGSPLMWWGTLTSLIYSISLTLLPISLTIAVLRYRLYDIDILINRTLVYGALTVTTIGIYVFIVGYLGNLFQSSNQTLLAFLATGLVALLFQPLRERLQTGVNRLMFGERDDPIAVLTSLSKRLEAAADPETILAGIVDTVAQALKLPYVAIEASNGQTTNVIAEHGEFLEGSEHLPLIHQSKSIGQLIFARRSPNERFSRSEYKLLRNISRQAGAAVHTAKLTTELRSSRQRLVTAREEERRRLRRDLHDGLGPTLAGATLRIDNARNKIVNNPEQAEIILVETKGQIQDTISDIRHLVYELRPPILDELGLEHAVRAYVEQQKIAHPRISIEFFDGLSKLPAAIEVAAYLIAVEGIGNVIHHAQATNVVIRFTSEHGNLTIEIKDDGVGLPDPFPSRAGITSIREKAEELGGLIQLIPQSPGTLLRACLPCPKV